MEMINYMKIKKSTEQNINNRYDFFPELEDELKEELENAESEGWLIY